MGWFGKSEEKPSGINTNPAFSDNARYEAIPFLLAMPQLTKKFRETLAKDAASGKPFFVWKVKPGDKVERDSVIGEFNLKSQALWRDTTGPVFMPYDGIITEISNNQTSPYLFAYQPLFPTTQAFNYRKDNFKQFQADVLDIMTHTDKSYWSLAQKAYLAVNDKDKGLPGNEANDFVNSEIEKMGRATIIPLAP